MVLYTYVCVYAFSLHRESPGRILGDKPLVFQGGVLSQLASDQDLGKTHMEASKNCNNVVGEERLAHIKTIVVCSGGKLTYVFFYATTELYQRRYIMIFGVLILLLMTLFCCLWL
jgi:hypothetical protein